MSTKLTLTEAQRANPQLPPELWKLADVAVFLHVHRNTASKWLKKVNLPVVNIGARRGSRKGKRWHNSMVIAAARAEAPRQIGKEAV